MEPRPSSGSKSQAGSSGLSVPRLQALQTPSRRLRQLLPALFPGQAPEWGGRAGSEVDLRKPFLKELGSVALLR